MLVIEVSRLHRSIRVAFLQQTISWNNSLSQRRWLSLLARLALSYPSE